MQAPLKDCLAPYVFPSTFLSGNMEECHSPKTQFVVSSTKSHRACFMASLDINITSKVEMKILSTGSSDALIYALSSYVNEMLICVSSASCKIDLLYPF